MSNGLLKRLVSQSDIIRSDDWFSRLLGHPLTGWATFAGIVHFKMFLWFEPFEAITGLHFVVYCLLWLPALALSMAWLFIVLGKRHMKGVEPFASASLVNRELLILLAASVAFVMPNFGRDDKPASMEDFERCIMRVDHPAGYKELASRIHDKDPLTKGVLSDACRLAEDVSRAHLPKPPEDAVELLKRYSSGTKDAVAVEAEKAAASSRLKDTSRPYTNREFLLCVNYMPHDRDVGYKVLARHIEGRGLLTKNQFDSACSTAKTIAMLNAPFTPRTLESLLERYGPDADPNSPANRLRGDPDESPEPTTAP